MPLTTGHPGNPIATKWGLMIVIAMFGGGPSFTFAEDLESSLAIDTAPSGDDGLWNHSVLFQDHQASVIQRFAITGRYHYDLISLDSDVGDLRDEQVRRFRLGFVTNLLDHFTFKSEADFDLNEADPFYQSLTDTYLQWKPTKRFKIRAGKQAAGFTLDGTTSANELITMERNNLSNNLWFHQVFIPGVLVEVTQGAWRYRAGIFSGGEATPEFGTFEGSSFGLFNIGYDFSEKWGVREAMLNLDYVYQDPDAQNSFTNPHEHVGSLNFRYDTGRWGFRSDLSASNGSAGQSDLRGIVIMPFYSFNDHLQWVWRYTEITGHDENGIRLNRYERALEPGLGDHYQEFYTGLNWYLHGHKLKWQSGLQFVELSDRAKDGGAYCGWGLTSGFRISW